MKRIFVIFVLFFAFAFSCFAYWEWTPQTGKWVNPKYAVKDTPKEQFEYAEKFRQEGNIEKAIREHKKLLEHYKNSEYAPKSCFALGEIYYNQGEYKKAFDYYQQIIDKYPQSELIFEAIKQQSEIGTKYLSIENKWQLPFLKSRKEEKGALLEKVVDNSPYSKEAPERLFNLGMFYMDVKNYERAEDIFRRIIETYPENPIIEKANFFLIKSKYLAIPDVNYDIEKLEKVENDISFFIEEYPDSIYNQELQKLADKIENEKAKRYYEIASLYERMGKKGPSLFYYRKIVENYPETEYGQKAKKKISSH